jgi:hypothetical protein
LIDPDVPRDFVVQTMMSQPARFLLELLLRYAQMVEALVGHEKQVEKDKAMQQLEQEAEASRTYFNSQRRLLDEQQRALQEKIKKMQEEEKDNINENEKENAQQEVKGESIDREEEENVLAEEIQALRQRRKELRQQLRKLEDEEEGERYESVERSTRPHL